MEQLQRAGVPAGAVLDTQELSEDPHLHWSVRKTRSKTASLR